MHVYVCVCGGGVSDERIHQRVSERLTEEK